MIGLRQKLYESLLDDEEDLVNDETIEFREKLKDKNFELYRYYGTIYDQPTFNLIDKNILSDDRDIYVDKDFKPLNTYLKSLDTLSARLLISIDIRDNRELSDKTICKYFETNHFSAFFANQANIKNIDYSVYNDNTGVFDVKATKSPINLENISIHGRNVWLKFFTYDIPIFNNVKLDSNTSMTIYNAEFESKKTGVTKAIEDILDPNYIIKLSSTVYDVRFEEKQSIKNIKKLLKKENHKKQIEFEDTVCKVKPNVKITDIFPNLPPNINKIKIEGNTITCKLMKPGYYMTGNDGKPLDGDMLSDGWQIDFYITV